jgi:ABC-type sugar transport system substrate-binding protein
MKYSVKRAFLFTALAFPLSLMSVAADADPIIPTVNTSPGTTYNTGALTGFQTDASLMVGSVVTVTYSNEPPTQRSGLPVARSAPGGRLPRAAIPSAARGPLATPAA